MKISSDKPSKTKDKKPLPPAPKDFTKGPKEYVAKNEGKKLGFIGTLAKDMSS